MATLQIHDISRPGAPAFLPFATAKEEDLTQSRKAAKRLALTARPALCRSAIPEAKSSLCAFAPLRDETLRGLVALCEPDTSGPSAAHGRVYTDAVSALRAVAMLCDPVLLGNRR
jgi:hypothetical protein